MKVLGIIPARMAATRFPGKPMEKISGIPMIGHILKRVEMSSVFEDVYVATCDEVIFDYVKSIGGKAVMTLDTHERCTERTSEALLKIEGELGKKYDVVGMVQGDEPLVVPDIFDDLMAAFETTDAPVVNIMTEITSEEEFISPNAPKVVLDSQNHALYMSREPIPSVKKTSMDFKKYKQTGLIFFKRDFLIEFNEMEPTQLEIIESVDMNRVIEHGRKVKMVLTEHVCMGVDVPEHVAEVEAVMVKDPWFEKYRSEFGV